MRFVIAPATCLLICLFCRIDSKVVDFMAEIESNTVGLQIKPDLENILRSDLVKEIIQKRLTDTLLGECWYYRWYKICTNVISNFRQNLLSAKCSSVDKATKRWNHPRSRRIQSKFTLQAYCAGRHHRESRPGLQDDLTSSMGQWMRPSSLWFLHEWFAHLHRNCFWLLFVLNCIICLNFQYWINFNVFWQLKSPQSERVRVKVIWAKIPRTEHCAQMQRKIEFSEEIFENKFKNVLRPSN